MLKSIPGYEGKYSASDDGRIWSVERRLWMKPHISAGGYFIVGVSGKQEHVHALVCSAFHCPRPDGLQTRHLNGCPRDNRASNLAWGTNKENAQDRARHGNDPFGERNGNSKLTEDIVRKIRKEYTESAPTYAALGRKYGVGSTAIEKVVKRERWSFVE